MLWFLRIESPVALGDEADEVNRIISHVVLGVQILSCALNGGECLSSMLLDNSRGLMRMHLACTCVYVRVWACPRARVCVCHNTA